MPVPDPAHHEETGLVDRTGWHLQEQIVEPESLRFHEIDGVLGFVRFALGRIELEVQENLLVPTDQV
jgi:hypothetical protein